MKKTIEQKASEALLEQPLELRIAGEVYEAAPPSLATLMLISERISQLPQVRLSSESLAMESLSIAKDCRPLAEIAAILILGAKRLKAGAGGGNPPKGLWQRLKGWFFSSREEVGRKELERLTEALLLEQSPSQLHRLIAGLLEKMELGDFFALTTFLLEVNMLRRTKVEEIETTALGQL